MVGAIRTSELGQWATDAYRRQLVRVSSWLGTSERGKRKQCFIGGRIASRRACERIKGTPPSRGEGLGRLGGQRDKQRRRRGDEGEEEEEGEGRRDEAASLGSARRGSQPAAVRRLLFSQGEYQRANLSFPRNDGRPCPRQPPTTGL